MQKQMDSSNDFLNESVCVKSGIIFQFSRFYQLYNQVKFIILCKCLHLAAQHGNKSSLRWIFSSLAIELKQGDLQSCSLLLFTAANWLGTIFIVRRWVQNALGLDQQII